MIAQQAQLQQQGRPSQARAGSASTPRLVASTTANAATANGASAPQTRVLVLGGTGRVGASAAWSLLTDPDRPGSYDVTLASRNRSSYDQALARRPQLKSSAASFARADATDRKSVEAAIRESGATVLVHAAGPFQRNQNYAALEAAMETGVSYVDICDDAEYAKG
jgi:saccharopine dehydrogenase-like NADP-dependent oxidoreductase